MSGLNAYVVSYDIRDQKRLYRVHRAMLGFGEPVRYSVFRCDLTPKGKVERVAALAGLTSIDDDRVMIIDLGPVDGNPAVQGSDMLPPVKLETQSL
ncbi:MAG: CRISPR-associated endonuclease Cas2 [Methanotrichaceae archaeon]|nr:CRISPR-associated endonuclease Cas2 [Methanotrichaceae archaeon]